MGPCISKDRRRQKKAAYRPAPASTHRPASGELSSGTSLGSRPTPEETSSESSLGSRPTPGGTSSRSSPSSISSARETGSRTKSHETSSRSSLTSRSTVRDTSSRSSPHGETGSRSSSVSRSTVGETRSGPKSYGETSLRPSSVSRSTAEETVTGSKPYKEKTLGSNTGETDSGPNPKRETTPRSASAQPTLPEPAQSDLERLPPDLRDKIALYSLEPSLARTSRAFGRAMSREPIYKLFILSAFFNNDEQGPVEKSLFAPAIYRCLTRTQRVHLQKDILQCPWFTYDRIKEQITTLIHLAMLQQWELHHQAQKTGTFTLRSPLPSRDNMKALKPFFQYGPHEHRIPDIPCTFVRQPLLGPWHSKDAVLFEYIPSRILNPTSWDIQSVNLLFFVSEHLPTLPEFEASALFQGFETAIRERSQVVLALAKIRTLSIEQMRQKGLDWAHLALPLRLFHLACQQGDDGFGVLALLITTSITNSLAPLPMHDDTLTTWATQRHTTANSAQGRHTQLARWIINYNWDLSPHVQVFLPAVLCGIAFGPNWDRPSICPPIQPVAG
jgi:hypothetical protein